MEKSFDENDLNYLFKNYNEKCTATKRLEEENQLKNNVRLNDKKQEFPYGKGKPTAQKWTDMKISHLTSRPWSFQKPNHSGKCNRFVDTRDSKNSYSHQNKERKDQEQPLYQTEADNESRI